MALLRVCNQFLRGLRQESHHKGDLNMLHISTFDNDQRTLGKGITIHYCGGSEFLYEKINETPSGDKTTSFRAPLSVSIIEKTITEHLGTAEFVRMIIGGVVVLETDL